MPFLVEGEARVAFTNVPGQTPQAPDNGELKVQQADALLISRKADGTARYTDLRSMLEQLADGPLAEAFAKTARALSTMAVLRAFSTDLLPDGAQVSVSGYYGIEDGGGGIFSWAVASTAADDGGAVIAPDGVAGPGRWHRVVNAPPTPRMFGARGDGSTNDTTAVKAWLAYGGALIATPGQYLIDDIDITKRVEVSGPRNAVFLQRSGGDRNHWLFRVALSASGSRFSGFSLNGRRMALYPTWVNKPDRLDLTQRTWGGLRIGDDDIGFANDVVVDDLYFSEFASIALSLYGGNNHKARATIENCGFSLSIQGNSVGDTNGKSYGHDIDVTAKNIQNGDFLIYAGAAEWRYLRNSRIKFRLSGYGSVAESLEPVNIAAGMDSCDFCFVDVEIDTYLGTHTHLGFQWVSNRFCHGTIKVRGFESALGLGTDLFSRLHVELDGEYKVVSNYGRAGLTLDAGGVFPISPAGLAGETSANATSHGTSISGTITRFTGAGAVDFAHDTRFDDLRCIGNNDNGIVRQASILPSISFPGGANIARAVSGARYSNCLVAYNGRHGIAGISGDDTEIRNCKILNNGQLQQLGFQNGVDLSIQPQGVKNWTVVDNLIDDTQNFVEAQGITFAPGSTDAKNRYSFDVLSPDRYEVGQFITLTQVRSDGGSPSGRIVDKNADILTLDFNQPITFAANASLRRPAGSGIGSCVGRTVTVPGGGLVNGANRILFREYLRHPTTGQCRQIVYVNSDTSMIVDLPFSTDIPAGSTLQVVRADISVAKTQAGRVLVGANLAGPLLLKGNRGGAAFDAFLFPSLTALAEGSEVVFHVDNVALSTSSPSTQLLAIPQGFQATKVDLTVTTAITGLGGASVGTIVNAITGQTDSLGAPQIFTQLSAGSRTIKYTGHYPPNPNDFGGVYLVFAGDASDNTPSGGAISMNISLKKW